MYGMYIRNWKFEESLMWYNNNLKKIDYINDVKYIYFA